MVRTMRENGPDHIGCQGGGANLLGYGGITMSVAPLYASLAADLRGRVDSGALSPGEPVASERRLSQELGVSRSTVRQALDVLVREGRLYRGGSRGTFVARPHLGLRIGSFTREVVGHGRVPGARVLASALVPAGAAAADALGVAPGEKVVEVVRLRTVDGEALAIERTVLPADLGVTLLGQDLEGSLWAALEHGCDVVAARAVVTVTAVTLGGDDAGLLGMTAGSAALLQVRRTFDADGRCFEWARDTYRGDRAALEAETDLTAPRDGGGGAVRDPADLLTRSRGGFAG